MTVNGRKLDNKLHDLQKSIAKAEKTLSLIKKRGKKGTHKHIDSYKASLKKQYKSSKNLQKKLFEMSVNSFALGISKNQRVQLLDIMNKNDHLQKRLNKFIRSSEGPVKLSSNEVVHEKIGVTPLPNELEVREWLLEETSEVTLLGDNFRVPEVVEPTESLLENTDAGSHDVLTEIKGITPQLEKILIERGINTFKKIANLSDRDVRKMDKKILFRGKFKRYDWVNQAKLKIHKS